MIYILKGNVRAWLCGNCHEPLADSVVRLYRHDASQNITALAVADPADTFAVLTAAEVTAKAPRLIAETRTDAEGNFVFRLGRDQLYEGGAVEVDVYCTTIPRRKPTRKQPPPRQISVTTIQPSWRELTEDERIAAWRYCIPQRYWCTFRGLFDAWVICGHLTSEGGAVPIPGATVSAFDVDWIQDDALGSAITDSEGFFRIDYTSADFKVTPFSPAANVEWVSGPDVFFRVTLGGDVLIQEPSSIGRTAARQNVGPCFYAELCTDKVHVPVDDQPHWQRVWDFDVHPGAPSPASSFSIEGYAGGPQASFVFGDANYRGGVLLRGNCPLASLLHPAHPLQYRFSIGEWTWPDGGDGDPAALPSIAPAALTPVTQIRTTTVGYVFYTNALGFNDSADVVITSADLDAEGWVTPILGRTVTVDMRNGTTASVVATKLNFLRTDELLVLHSTAITSRHPLRMPGGLPKSDAGRSLTSAEREPIRRYALRFEVRDATSLGAVYGDTLTSIILDNTPIVVALDLEELRANVCNPVGADTAAVHILYTADHPHMNAFAVTISSNAGTAHPAPALPSGSFLPGPDIFFRGGASGPHNASDTGGFAVDVSGDRPCAYRVTLAWQTRQYLATGSAIELLYCK